VKRELERISFRFVKKSRLKREFEIYREREMRQLESDFDKAVKRLRNKKN
jgi:transposase